MSAIAGFSSTIESSTDDTTYNSIGGADSVTFNRTRTELDATDFSHSAMVRILGIKDVSLSISGKYDASDTGQGQLDTAFEATTVANQKLWLRFLPDGTSGYKAQFVVTNFETSSTTDGVVEFSCDLSLSDSSGWTSV